MIYRINTKLECTPSADILYTFALTYVIIFNTNPFCC